MCWTEQRLGNTSISTVATWDPNKVSKGKKPRVNTLMLVIISISQGAWRNSKLSTTLHPLPPPNTHTHKNTGHRNVLVKTFLSRDSLSWQCPLGLVPVLWIDLLQFEDTLHLSTSVILGLRARMLGINKRTSGEKDEGVYEDRKMVRK